MFQSAFRDECGNKIKKVRGNVTVSVKALSTLKLRLVKVDSALVVIKQSPEARLRHSAHARCIREDGSLKFYPETACIPQIFGNISKL